MGCIIMCIDRCMSEGFEVETRTNIVLDDDLIREAFRYCSVKTKRDLIHLALREFVERKKRMNLLDLEGKVQFEEDYDYKQMRK